MYLKTLSAKRHTCCWAFVLSEIFCGRNQRYRVKTHIIFPPSLCNWSVTVSHRSQGAKGVHGQSDKSEKSDMLAWAVSIHFGILEMEETVRTRYHFSSISIHMPGPKNILSLKICSSWGMKGISIDQIAEVFTMDAAEVVKILERAERSTSKDGVDIGTRWGFRLQWGWDMTTKTFCQR